MTKKVQTKKKVVTKKKVQKASKPKVQTKPNTKSQLPTIGQPAPDFSLPNQDGKMVSLSSLKGQNVVVYFYPRAMTPGCTVQACGLRDIKKELQKNNIVILGISPDAPKSLVKFIERDKLNFDLLSDEDHQVALKYGSWGKKQFMGRTFDGILRQSFLIDKEGILQKIIDKVNTKTHAEEVLAFFQR